nr:hypothetical protein [Bacteroidota bacterium]
MSARTKEIYDNVIPSSNSVMAFTLNELSQITTNREFEKIAFSMLKSIGNNLTRHASSFAHWGALMLNHVNNFYTIVITGPDAGLWQHELYEKCKYPLKIILWGNDGATLPVFHGRLGKGQTTIYVCAGNVCKLPVHSVEEALRQIC